MNLFNNFPSFEPACSDTCSGSLDSIEQMIPPGDNEQQPAYQGMSVHVLELSLPAYHNQSDLRQNNADSFHFLDEYNIDNLILTNPAAAFGNDLPDIPQSALDYYVPWHSDNEPVNARPAPGSGIPFIQQAFLSVSEPETRKPIPMYHWYPDDQIINLSIAPSNPQNLNQTTSDSQTSQTEVMADSNAAMVESQRKFRNDPAFEERKRERKRNYQKERYKDPAFAEHKREKNREYHREHYKDPAYAEHKRGKNREYLRERCKDPVFLERKREKYREYYRERCKDPVFLERRRKRQRECKKERKRERKRERNQNNLDHAKRQRESQISCLLSV